MGNSQTLSKTGGLIYAKNIDASAGSPGAGVRAFCSGIGCGTAGSDPAGIYNLCDEVFRRTSDRGKPDHVQSRQTGIGRKPLPAGGYVAKILNAKVEEYSWGEVLVISFDIAQRDKYELDLKGKFEVVLREGKYYVERIKPKYPKTYEECCRVVNANPCIRLVYDLSDGQKYSYDVDNLQHYENIRKLLICRDAYWKIAGEQMGLGKPWEPYWTIYKHKFCLGTDKDKVIEECVTTGNRILAFPTSEMRDAFKENFDGDIDACKEFL